MNSNLNKMSLTLTYLSNVESFNILKIFFHINFDSSFCTVIYLFITVYYLWVVDGLHMDFNPLL